tara:strand:+ start:497 stop:2293 length:1797 start_codon:yes stop_codon:yes gene_type:complete
MSNPLFNYDVEVDPMSIDIRSDTLEPISSSKRRYVFRLDSAGTLDQNSVLLFKANANNASSNSPADNRLRANPMFGGLTAIKKATIQIGDYILNNTEDIGKISALTQMSTMRESTRNKLLGHYYQNSFHSKVVSVADNTVSLQGGVGSIVYDNKKSGVDYGNLGNNDNNRVNSCIIQNNPDSNQQFGISLGTLLPCLKNRSLPLYLFQEYRILITIEFHDAPEWVNYIGNTASQNSIVADSNKNRGMIAGVDDVSYSDVKLQVDYLIMPSEVQAQSRNQINSSGGLRLDFFDIIKVEKNIPATTANVIQEVEHRIGADNKEVHKIYMLKKKAQSIGEITALSDFQVGSANRVHETVNISTLTTSGGVGAVFEGVAIPNTSANTGAVPALNFASLTNKGYGYKVGDVLTLQTTGTVDTTIKVSAVSEIDRPMPEDKLFCGARCDGMNQEEYNVNIDGVDIFQENKWNPNSQYDEVSNCLGGDLEMVKPLYFNDENSITSRIAEPQGGLLGKYKPLCLDLTNGEPTVVGGGRNIGAYPIIWKYKRKPLGDVPNPATSVNSGIGNIANQCNGALNVDYFMLVSRVANVRSTPQGTQVSVSY